MKSVIKIDLQKIFIGMEIIELILIYCAINWLIAYRDKFINMLV